MRKALFYIPLVLFLSLAVFLLSGLFSDPRERDSAVIGRALPEFQLPDLQQPSKMWTPAALKGEAFLLNVWGVWCPTCNAELGYMTQLKNEQGVRIIGLYYVLPEDPMFGEVFNLQNLQAEVSTKLQNYGDPYQFNILDQQRRLSLDLGVSGAPEHFIVDAEGIIRAHHIGDINPQVWRSKLAPIYQQWAAK